MRILRTYISIFLVVTMAFAFVPKEFIHDFYGHKDTIDQRYQHGFVHVEEIHHHCEMLTYTVFPFMGGGTALHKELPVFSKPLKAETSLFQAQKCIILHSRFRAPPAV